ncbi:unnamed protein product [Sympodiomycopsis kandeliae]
MKFTSAALVFVTALAGVSALQAPALEGGALGDLTGALGGGSKMASRDENGLFPNVNDEALKYATELYPNLKNHATRSENGSGQKPAALVHREHRRNAEDNSQTSDDNRGMCSVGNPVCCNQEVKNTDAKKQLAGLAGVGDLVGSIGLACQSLPIGIAPISLSNYCKSSPLCCTHVTQNGLVNLGCINVPIN